VEIAKPQASCCALQAACCLSRTLSSHCVSRAPRNSSTSSALSISSPVLCLSIFLSLFLSLSLSLSLCLPMSPPLPRVSTSQFNTPAFFVSGVGISKSSPPRLTLSSCTACVCCCTDGYRGGDHGLPRQCPLRGARLHDAHLCLCRLPGLQGRSSNSITHPSLATAKHPFLAQALVFSRSRLGECDTFLRFDLQGALPRLLRFLCLNLSLFLSLADAAGPAEEGGGQVGQAGEETHGIRQGKPKGQVIRPCGAEGTRCSSRAGRDIGFCKLEMH